MGLPNRDKAYIPLSKLTAYLLSETHAVGRSKARFFRAIGFNEANVVMLEQSLLTIARSGAVVEVGQSPYGTKYIIDGGLATPNGVPAEVRTVWIVEVDDVRPRFVTAYPASRT